MELEDLIPTLIDCYSFWMGLLSGKGECPQLWTNRFDQSGVAKNFPQQFLKGLEAIRKNLIFSLTLKKGAC